MKTFAAALGAIALAGAMNGAVPQAASARANDNVETCRLLVSLNFYESQGQCMGAVRSQAPRVCRQLRDFDALDFFGWRTVGECVSSFRAAD